MYISTRSASNDLNNINDSPFRLGSSNVDWCEPNYVVSRYIAEFWNTVSNVFFFLVPPLSIILFASYSKRVANGITILWIFLIVIGIGSVYFHATLSLAGQLLDEICILWVLMAAYALFIPTIYQPPLFRVQRLLYTWSLNKRSQQHRFVYSCIVLAAIITCLSIIYPYANAFALMVLGLPALAFLILNVSRSDNRRIKCLGLHCVGIVTAAIIIWLCDRMFCSFWISISFPYLHAIWHVLILLGSNEAIVVCSYFVVKHQYPQANLGLHAWPNDQWGWFSLPYLKFHDDGDYLSSSSSTNLASKFIV